MACPIGVKAFFSKWGLSVIKSELLWIWLPSSLLLVLSTLIRTLAARHWEGWNLGLLPNH
jgi:hypothetical protein